MNLASGGPARHPAQHAFDSARLARVDATRISRALQVRSKCSNSPAGNPIPPSWCSRPTAAMFCGASRRASCCRRRTRSTASFGSRGACRTPTCRWRSPCPVRGPEVIGSAFYVMDYVEGRIFWDAALPEVAAARPPRHLRRDGARAGGAALGGLHGGGSRRLRQARQLCRAPGGTLDAAISRLARPKRSTRWNGSSSGCRSTFPPASRPPSCTATSGSTTRFFIPPSRGSWRCSTGSCRPWVIRWSISPTTACAITCRPRVSADLAGWTPRRCMIPTEAECVADYCRLRGIAPVAAAGLDLLPRVLHVPAGRDSAGRAGARPARQRLQRHGAAGGTQRAAAGRAGLAAGATSSSA